MVKNFNGNYILVIIKPNKRGTGVYSTGRAVDETRQQEESLRDWQRDEPVAGYNANNRWNGPLSDRLFPRKKSASVSVADIYMPRQLWSLLPERVPSTLAEWETAREKLGREMQTITLVQTLFVIFKLHVRVSTRCSTIFRMATGLKVTVICILRCGCCPLTFVDLRFYLVHAVFN